MPWRCRQRCKDGHDIYQTGKYHGNPENVNENVLIGKVMSLIASRARNIPVREYSSVGTPLQISLATTSRPIEDPPGTAIRRDARQERRPQISDDVLLVFDLHVYYEKLLRILAGVDPIQVPCRFGLAGL